MADIATIGAMVDRYYKMVDKYSVMDRDGTPDDVVYKFMDDEMQPLLDKLEELSPWLPAKEEFVRMRLQAGKEEHQDKWHFKLDMLWDLMGTNARLDISKKMASDGRPELTGLVYLVEAKDFWMLWHNDYWDGPLSGYVRLPDGRMAKFSCLDDPVIMHTRSMIMYEISWWQEFKARLSNSMFKLFVGSHNDYAYEGLRRVRAIKSDEYSSHLKPYWMHPIYYESANVASKIKKFFGINMEDWSKAKRLGWFMLKV